MRLEKSTTNHMEGRDSEVQPVIAKTRANPSDPQDASCAWRSFPPGQCRDTGPSTWEEVDECVCRRHLGDTLKRPNSEGTTRPTDVALRPMGRVVDGGGSSLEGLEPSWDGAALVAESLFEAGGSGGDLADGIWQPDGRADLRVGLVPVDRVLKEGTPGASCGGRRAETPVPARSKASEASKRQRRNLPGTGTRRGRAPIGLLAGRFAGVVNAEGATNPMRGDTHSVVGPRPVAGTWRRPGARARRDAGRSECVGRLRVMRWMGGDADRRE